MAFKVPEKYRSPDERFAGDEQNGVFIIKKGNTYYICIATNGLGWEHVSVRAQSGIPGKTQERTLRWDEMCFIKDLFWDEEDCVVQYHPPKSDYVNNHPNVLHLWRPIGSELPRPPSVLVGRK